MNSTNETLLFDRFLIMYNFCVFTCIIIIFVFHCTHVQMSYVLNSYLLLLLSHLHELLSGHDTQAELSQDHLHGLHVAIRYHHQQNEPALYD